MTSRRTFLKSAGTLAAGLSVSPLIAQDQFQELSERIEISESGSVPLAEDESFWGWVRNNYFKNTDIINFNNGGVSPHAKRVHKYVERLSMEADEVPSFQLWRVQEKQRPAIKDRLGKMIGVPGDELAINRNTTEALDTIIFGIDLNKGDEIVHSNFIYPNMNQAWMQREMREGIVRKIAKLSLPTTDEDALVKAYTDQFSNQTKIVHITHVINWTGQIMPVAKIAAEAKKIGARVIVDGAHSFAHFPFTMQELNCDYFGTSLHKWLGAPFGTGMLWMKKEWIANHWALFPGPDPKSPDISKFECQGTRDVPKELGIEEALNFHDKIGMERKSARLHYLKEYWASKVQTLDKVSIKCPIEQKWSGAVATVSIEGLDAKEIARYLWDTHKIHTTTINHEGINACRISPNVYTSKEELDKLVEAITDLAS